MLLDDYDDDDDNNDDSSSCASDFIHDLEESLKRDNSTAAATGEDDSDDSGWDDVVEEIEKEVDEQKRIVTIYEKPILFYFDAFLEARRGAANNNSLRVAKLFNDMVCVRMHRKFLARNEMRNMLKRNVLAASKFNTVEEASQLVKDIVQWDSANRGVLLFTYHPMIVARSAVGFRPYGGVFTMFEVCPITSYHRAVLKTNAMLIAHDYARFVRRARELVPEIADYNFVDHRVMWRSFFGRYALKFKRLCNTNNLLAFDTVFFRELHLATTLRGINATLIDIYYGGNAGACPKHHLVTVRKLRKDSPWMFNDHGSAEELAVLRRIRRYVQTAPVAAVPSAFQIVNWENMYWYNAYPLEAIIALNVVEPYKHMVRGVLGTIEDEERSYFFRKHMEGPDLPESYVVPIIPKDHFMEDIAGAWVWDMFSRGTMQSM